MTSFRRFLLPALLAFFLCPSASFGSEIPAYRLGEGLKIPSTPLRVGGYANVVYEDSTAAPDAFTFDDLSFFVFGDIGPRTRFFSEIEDEHFIEVPVKGKVSTRSNWQIERLYLDYLRGERFNLRAGKFLTPVGTWNEIHADPLTWTVSRPVVTFAAFPEFITGAGFFGDFAANSGEFAYFAFLQNNESINEATGFRRTHKSYGARFRWLHPSGVEAGAPFVYYVEDELSDSIYLTGLDVTYRLSSFELRGEGTYATVDEGHDWTKEYGYYLQGVYGLTGKHFVVLRHETFRARGDSGRFRAWSFGGVYKFAPQMVFKVEYQARGGGLSFEEEDVDDSDRVLASFSILL